MTPLRNLKHQKPPVDPFTREEAERMLAALYPYEGKESIYAAYFESAFFSGMRSSEMLALRWSDIDEDRDYVSKARSKGRLNDYSKNSTIRDVLLNERTLHAFDVAYSITYHADGYVFKSPRLGVEFKTEKAPRDGFTDLLKQLDMRHRPAYNTRHTYATMLLMTGVNLHFVANQLGRSPIMTATVYAKWINGEADTRSSQNQTRAPTNLYRQRTRRK